MSKLATSLSRLATKAHVADRLRQVRIERHGQWGESELAETLGIPAATWLNYERGVTIPGQVLLGFLIATGVEARWLLLGEGAKYRPPAP